jgi:hypothetical protein
MCSSSLITAYADNECSSAQELGAITVSATEATCLNLPPTSTLGSMSATTPVYTPGTCQANGGVQTGGVQKIGPITFCCQD